MLSSSTPFKIHDENAGVPMSRKKGLNPTAKGLGGVEGLTKTPKVPKSNRKALGSISVNVKGQKAEGIHVEKAPSVLHFPPPTSSKATGTKKSSVTTIDSSSMICSHITKDEDAYDFVMRNAANIKTVIVPGTTSEHDAPRPDCLNVWQDDGEVDINCAALSMGDNTEEDYTFAIPTDEDW